MSWSCYSCSCFHVLFVSVTCDGRGQAVETPRECSKVDPAFLVECQVAGVDIACSVPPSRPHGLIWWSESGEEDASVTMMVPCRYLAVGLDVC
jgi:hypothetical protein